jgi:hypothetical protein
MNSEEVMSIICNELACKAAELYAKQQSLMRLIALIQIMVIDS